jgi:hypothetical protein
MKSDLLALAQRMEEKLLPPRTDLFSLINRNSHLLEKIGRRALKLHEALTDYESNPGKFSKEKLVELEGKLKEVLVWLESL